VAEAGRESNELARPQQLSLIDHRESDYISALERALFRAAAHAEGISHKRIPESIIASGSNEIGVARKHRARASVVIAIRGGEFCCSRSGARRFSSGSWRKRRNQDCGCARSSRCTRQLTGFSSM
jgi:hypothetical protein